MSRAGLNDQWAKGAAQCGGKRNDTKRRQGYIAVVLP